MTPATPRMPPLASVLKSREVEDPVNVYLQRPLAYLIAKLLLPTRVTPNMVTVGAVPVGLVAGFAWFEGSPTWMVVGGVALWTWAILDGADGMLARARGTSSDFGRALDGACDGVVAIVSLGAALTHIYATTGDATLLGLAIPALVLSYGHIYLYDYYKESYLRFTRPGRSSDGSDATPVAAKVQRMVEEGASPARVFLMKHVYLPLLVSEQRMVRATNPGALREHLDIVVDERVAAVYRKHNLGPMRVWVWLSVAPHTYLFAICGMVDRLDGYLWLRLLGMNALFLVALVYQRHSTRRMRAELRALGHDIRRPATAGVLAGVSGAA